MKYYSLNGHIKEVNFAEAVLESIAADNGLYFPKNIERLPEDILSNFRQMDKVEIAYHAIKQFIGDEIAENDLKQIISETINFDFPLVEIEKNIYTLELFHGPTMAFKDVGARFMARCLSQFRKDKKITVLVATSGDTGGAVADGFFDVEGIEVIILYPQGKVSDLQEKQLTTFGKNIKALEVKGDFDDCQTMVKKAFLDTDLKNKLGLTSANSINVARWLPQMFYYIFALQQLPESVVFSVPSGNFGNICAGMVAQQLGFPIKHFVASNNINDSVRRYLLSGAFSPKEAKATISNAMDVGAPSNFDRMIKLYESSFDLKQNLSAYSYTDEQTAEALKSVFKNTNYLMDTHGTIGYLGLKEYFSTQKEKSIGVFLETAHPAKFANVIAPIIAQDVPLPTQLGSIMDKEKQCTVIDADFQEFKQLLENA